jgi:hypothetical protein
MNDSNATASADGKPPGGGMMPVKTLTANGVTYTCPFADSMEPLTPEERAALTADIRANGITYAVVVTDDNEVIDGHNRLEIATELGIADVPVKVLTELTPGQKRERAEDLNLHRRHLDRDQMRKVVARRLVADPTRSNRDIGTSVGVDDKTVGKVRAGLEATAEIPQLAATRGRDGKMRTTTRKPKAVAGPPPSAPRVADGGPDHGDARKPAKPLAWWPELKHDGVRVAAIGAELKKLSNYRKPERSPGPVLDVARRLRQVADQLERQAAEGGPQ